MNNDSNKKVSRRKFLALTGVSAAGLLAACAPPPAGAPAAPAAPAAKPAEAKATEAPAKEAPKDAGSYELLYVYPNFNAAGIKDLPAVNEKMNQMLQERIGMTIKLESIDFGAWGDKIQLMSAGGEKYDMAYTATWTNDYYKNVSNGVFAEIDDLIQQRAPGLYKSMPEKTWNAAKVKGKLYATINQQMFPKLAGVVMRKDLVEKYKIPVNELDAVPQLEPHLKAIAEGEKLVPLGDYGLFNYAELYNHVPVYDGTNYIWVDPFSGDAKLKYTYEMQEFTDSWKLHRSWWEKSYVPKDLVKSDEVRANWKAGKHAVQFNPVTKPKGEAEARNIYGYDMVLRALCKPALNTAGIVATLTGVSRTGDPDKSLQFLELINTDKSLYNLLCIGVEGKHWNWKNKDSEVIEQVKDSAYNPTTDWMFGNQFNAYYREEAQVGSWAETKKINDSATPSPLLGFAFDPEPVKTEIAAVAAVLESKTPFGSKGQSADDLPAIAKEIRDAGATKVLEEMQKQIDTWKSAK